MSRRRIFILISLVAVLASLVAVPSASADIPTDVNAEWTALEDVQLESWVNDGALTTDETVAVADAVVGTAGIAAIGPVALVAGGVMVVDAVWKSGLGSSIGHWLANYGQLQVGSFVTHQDWCPYVQPTWTGTYGTQTVSPPVPLCGFSSQGDYAVGTGAKLPPYNVQELHLFDTVVDSGSGLVHVGYNTDNHNYFTMDFWGSNCHDLSNTGMFGGNNELDFSMFLDTNPTAWSGKHSGNQFNCVSDAWVQSVGTAGTWASNLVRVRNTDCVITLSGAGPCGTGGLTCKQMAIREISTSGDGTTDYTGPCYWVALTEKQMIERMGGTKLQPCGNTGQVACPTTSAGPLGLLTLGSNTATTNCGGQAPCVAALDKLDSETGDCTYALQSTCGTPSTRKVRDKVGCKLYGTNCSTTSTDPLSLPKPKINETYDQYINRLRALGFWGFISEQDDDMDYPVGTPAYLLNPGVVTEIKIGTGTPIPMYYPVPGHGLSGSPSSSPKAGEDYPWPGDENVPPDTTITILKVPDSWGGPTGSGVGDGGGPCNCPLINFTPLTGISYGSRFPFGAFTFLNSAISSFTGAGTGTPVTFDLSLLGSTKTITFQSSEWEGTYRPIIFPILEFLMTLGGVVWLALRLIGHPGGDDEGDG